MLLKKKNRGIERRRSITGLKFVSIWIIGFILFFLVPLTQSVLYSFSKVKVTEIGVKLNFVSLDNYRYAIMEDPYYLKILRESIMEFLYSMPLILVVSLVLALILNQRFKGRLLFRAMFFLPVIIASGPVLDVLFSTTTSNLTQMGVSQSLTANMLDISDIMNSLDLPGTVAGYVSRAISNIFDLIWSSGAQIILFIAGLQAIPSTVYEASKVEGATKWEEFWFITFPMMSRVVLLVGVFTMIELFTDKRSSIISSTSKMMSAGNYDETSAMLWFYFVIVGAIMGLIIALYNHFLLKKWK